MRYQDAFDRVWAQQQDGAYLQVSGPGFPLAELQEEHGPLVPMTDQATTDDLRSVVRGEIMRALEIIREEADASSRFGYPLADAANAEIADRMEEAIRSLRGES